MEKQHKKGEQMNEIKVFEGKEVEVVEFNGQVLFNAKHVAEILEIKNVNDNISRMSNKQVMKLTNSIIGETDFRKLHNTGENFLTESGVYKLVFKSHKESAERFQDWVTDEVLPSIRKHGAYMTEGTLEQALTSPDFLIQLATKLKEEKEKNSKLVAESSMQKQIIGELKPKADYVNKILDNPGLVTITQIAKDYGMSGQAMNSLLHQLKVQYRTGKQWLLYADYHDKGYTHSKTINITRSDGTPDVTMETKWTQKGRLFIYELLKSNGTLPVIERKGDKNE